MSKVFRSTASLRCVGVDPAEVAAALGRPPTHSMTKGEPMVRKGRVVRSAEGAPLIAKANVWGYSAAPREPEDLDGQIAEICAALTDDLSVWRGLGARGRLDLFVGLFLREENEGMKIGPHALALLAERGVTLGLDIHCGLEPEAQPRAK